jgi:hypothetical protein
MKKVVEKRESVFEELRSRLAKFSDRLTFDQTDRALLIKPIGPDTFPIEVRDDGKEITIFACRWLAHLEDPEQAIYCILWLLTPIYRIVEVERNGSWVKSWLDRFMPPGEWMVDHEVCAFLSPLRRKGGIVRISHRKTTGRSLAFQSRCSIVSAT